MNGFRFGRFVSRVAILAPLFAVATLCVSVAPASAVTYTYVRTIGSPGSSPGQLYNAEDVAVSQTGKLLVTSANGLEVYSSAGTFLNEITSIHGSALNSPKGLAVDRSTGDIYVAVRALSTIRRLNSAFGWLNDCGVYAAAPSDTGFGDVDGIAFGGRENLYTTDHTWSRIGIYSFSGAASTFWSFGSHGSGPGQFLGPNRIAFDDNDLCYVGDYTNGRVQIYRPGGAYVNQWSVTNEGVDVDPAGNVYVAEASYQPRVERYDQNGHKLDDFGPLGSVNTSSFGAIGAVRDDGHRHLLVLDWDRGHVVEMATSVPTTYTAAAGADRYQTAVEVSKASYPLGLIVNDPEGWTSVIVASGANWPDALGAAPLAGAYRSPLLLVRPGSVPSSVVDEIQRLGAGRIFVVGGPGAVSDAVITQLGSIPSIAGRVVRIAGADRYATSRLCAQAALAQARGTKWGFVTTGATFPDALAASPIAYARKAGVYLCSRDSTVVASQANVDGVGHVVILGGTGAVTTVTENALKAQFGAAKVERWAGADRYDTSVQVATHATMDTAGASNLGRLAIATGTNFPDALGGGPAVGRGRGTLLLTKPGSLPAGVSNLLSSRRAEVYRLWFLGGTGAVSGAVRTTVRGLLY